MSKTQAEILKKISTSDLVSGGLLNPTQAKKFFTSTVNESVLKEAVRSIFMPSPTYIIDKMSVGTRVAVPKVEATAPAGGDYVGLTTSKVEIITKAIIVPWEISSEFLEDNIEKENFEDSLMRDITAQLSNDLEELYLLGDTLSGDAFLAMFDGWLKLMQTGGHANVLAAATTLGKAVFSKLIKSLPTKYQRDNKKLRFLVNTNQEQDYRYELTTRNTGLGDASLMGDQMIQVFGIQIVPVPAMPAGTVVLTNYKNLIQGIHSNIKILKDEDIYKNVRQYAIHLRVGCEIENTDAISYTLNVADPV